MGDLFFNNSIGIYETKSTDNMVKQHKMLKKSIKKVKGCHCQKLDRNKKYKIQSPDESSNDIDGWEEEEDYQKQLEKRRNNKEFVDLVQYASQLECIINFAKQQLKELEETMHSNHAIN
ncbi:unnamed protein product [Paramecium sonneborni]|uniref:Uncharacterized protein n=1 Tax=Paramecium sonneborni TaxID=65129 RepID=A0A8S1QWU8_9CILI|nr:unnamed protein product [Paramecium sonneborni]CAD8120386.1 unnamed protein product [Paramecium sonneborni]